MQLKTRRFTVDWGHLAFLIVIGGWTLWYLLDALSVSMNLHNLLFIAPIGVLALLLCLAIIRQCIARRDGEPQVARPARQVIGMAEALPAGGRDLLRILGVALSLGLLVSLMNVIGFDIATFLFAVAIMFICGERRPMALLLYPLGVTLVLVPGFRAILPFPMPTTIL